MNKLKKFWQWFNGSNSAEAKCIRTIFQGIIGVLIALVTAYNGADPMLSLVICPICMAILAPVQAYLGGNYNEVQ